MTTPKWIIEKNKLIKERKEKEQILWLRENFKFLTDGKSDNDLLSENFSKLYKSCITRSFFPNSISDSDLYMIKKTFLSENGTFDFKLFESKANAYESLFVQNRMNLFYVPSFRDVMSLEIDEMIALKNKNLKPKNKNLKSNNDAIDDKIEELCNLAGIEGLKQLNEQLKATQNNKDAQYLASSAVDWIENEILSSSDVKKNR